MNPPKNAFDFSGASIWTKDKELVQINNGKINGSKRREQMRLTETLNVRESFTTYSKARAAK
jgi:hypothetical protein